MSIYEKLSSRSGGKGEEAEVALAIVLAEKPNPQALQELVAGLKTNDKALQADCIKVLYEIGYRDPQQIAPFANDFLPLLNSKNNRMVWGGMIALSTIAQQSADTLFPHLEHILKAFEKGSVITKDAGVSVLAGIASANPEYAAQILPILFEHLKSCRPSSVAQHAERASVAIRPPHYDAFREILQNRLLDLSEAQTRRVKKLIKQFTKMA